MNQKHELDPRLSRQLAVLEFIPERNPENAVSGRAAFLKEAQNLVNAVIPSAQPRHNRWIYALQSIFIIRKMAQSSMFSAFATIMLIVALLLGGGGVTVAAAQTSQPDQALYGLKVWSEDVRLGLSTDPLSDYRLALEYANRRSEEIRLMLEEGAVPPEAVQARYETQVEQAIQFAVNLPDAQVVQALLQIQTRLETQQQAFLQLQQNNSPDTNAVLRWVQQMLQERLKWVEEGLENPGNLRDQQNLRDQLRLQDPLNSPTPEEQGTRVQPETGNSNPWTTGTATQGSGYGPATSTCDTCTPTGDGQGDNPWITGTPTPGSGYGPGPTPMSTCTPVAGSNPDPQPTQQQYKLPTQSGPQPTQQQNIQPTQEPQSSTPSGPGGQSTSAPGGKGGNH
jgi:hypothetical protein